MNSTCNRANSAIKILAIYRITIGFIFFVKSLNNKNLVITCSKIISKYINLIKSSGWKIKSHFCITRIINISRKFKFYRKQGFLNSVNYNSIRSVFSEINIRYKYFKFTSFFKSSWLILFDFYQVSILHNWINKALLSIISIQCS